MLSWMIFWISVLHVVSNIGCSNLFELSKKLQQQSPVLIRYNSWEQRITDFRYWWYQSGSKAEITQIGDSSVQIMFLFSVLMISNFYLIYCLHVESDQFYKQKLNYFKDFFPFFFFTINYFLREKFLVIKVFYFFLIYLIDSLFCFSSTRNFFFVNIYYLNYLRISIKGLRGAFLFNVWLLNIILIYCQETNYFNAYTCHEQMKWTVLNIFWHEFQLLFITTQTLIP